MLQQTLSQLRLANIATLDACMNHFTRLIDLTSADEEYVAALATSLAPSILRPRAETSLTLEEKHAYKLVRDLFAHKDPIFSALKRMSTLNHSSSVSSTANRPRAISTDESNRKALMEERNRALLEKASATRTRATSPGPSPRGHRRDRSTGGPETRFPIQTSPTSAADRHRVSLGSITGGLKRASLEVPGPESAGSPDATNGSEPSKTDADSGSEKRDSLPRTGAKFVGGRRVPATPPQDGSARGVTLEDRPMDD